MKQYSMSKRITLLIPLVAFFVFSIFLVYSNNHNSYDSIAHNSVDQIKSQPYDFASDKNPVSMCLPANLPIDLTIDLLNEPQSLGDIAFFEIKFTSRIKHDGLKAYLVLPDGTIRESGDDEWEGQLDLNESKQLDAGIMINTEEAISLQAIVEITRNDTSFYVGKSFQLDLGEKAHAALTGLAVSGFAGADSLNLIVPAGI